jgi:MFS family permease
MISQVIGLVTIFLGGILMDIYGRKKLMMFSFAYLGATYAIMSVSRGSLFFFTVLDGIAWGMLTVMFLLVIWGDVCKPANRAIWIALSLSSTMITTPLKLIVPHIFAIYKISTDVFPIASLFLFIAVVIIQYLPETLPDKIIQKKELDDYINMAKKVKEKYKN